VRTAEWDVRTDHDDAAAASADDDDDDDDDDERHDMTGWDCGW
jgi:hypothetical protein